MDTQGGGSGRPGASIGVTPKLRIVVVLADIEGMAHKDIALAAEINVGTVKSRPSRGRRLLRQTLLNAGAS